ncbi:MAG: ATP synthase F1 subunit epsilon [Peptococcaceae bacterium]|jgi:F-type H+-transporting ATPase subunit epsilon|nr:ATP synthase F1 subunit epsilon [Peptococcaceae bacterium]
MTKTFLLSITTPEKQFYNGPAESLVITSHDGEKGIWPGHLSMVVALAIAPVRFKVAGQWKLAALTGGFARVRSDRVIILADTAEWPEEIEINRALSAEKRAEERLQTRLSRVEYLRSRIALERAHLRLTVKGK